MLLVIGRTATWVVLTPPRRGLRLWTTLRPAQQLALGFAGYVLIGWALLCLPWSRQDGAAPLDHLFTSVSAVSTTGLVTVATGDTYSTFGEFVVLVLFQLGGLGFMTLSSVLVLARGGRLTESREGVLRAGFAVPHYFNLSRFIVQAVSYTAVVETLGAGVLWWRFSELGAERPLWQAIFHSVSAFATAGFGLEASSLVRYADDLTINLTIAVLSLLGAIGFIVFQDLWYSIRFRERMITFTSRVILTMTATILGAGTILVYVLEPRAPGVSAGGHFLRAAFQTVSASSTAGFNSVPIEALRPATLTLIIMVMLVGASPSGTGGGLKTTTISALLATMLSILRGRESVRWLGHEIPPARLMHAVASATMYLLLLALGVGALCVTEPAPFISIVFEAASAIGTVGLSMGLTGELSALGKGLCIALMFVGRCGPLTLGLALLRPDTAATPLRRDDLAV